MKTNEYVLGLDIGITSVGWGIVDSQKMEIIDAGVRLFEEGTASENEKRRSFRGGRRLKSRRQTRRDDLKKILKKYNLLDESSIDFHPLDLRVKGISEHLNNAELTKALLHIVKHRGTTLDVVDDEEDDSKQNAKEVSEDKKGTKAHLSDNNRELNGRFVCELQLERLKNNGSYHGNKNVFKVEQYVQEAKQILNNSDVNVEAIDEIIGCIKRKRMYYEGPGSEKSPSEYGRFVYRDGKLIEIDLIEKMMGHCTIYPDELRAPRMSFTAEWFNLLNDLNNLSINSDGKISAEKKVEIKQKVKADGGITVNKLCKLLGIDVDAISGFRVDKNDKPLLTEFKGYKKLMKALSLQPELLDDEKLLDKIAVILTNHKGLDMRDRDLKALGVEFLPETFDALKNATQFSGTHAFSLKAMREMIPDLENTSRNQMQILADSNKRSFMGKVSETSQIVLDDSKAILSPVAVRAIHEALKVVNSLRKEYGEFKSITVEMTRDKNSDEQKKRIKDMQKFFEGQNQRAKEVLEKYPDVRLTPKLVMKIRLYLEQNSKTVYTNEAINLDRLIKERSAYEVDHIIPISHSFDDSFSNKVLVSQYENQQKGQLSPYLAFKNNKFPGHSWEEFTTRIKGVYRNRNQKNKLHNLMNMDDFSHYNSDIMKKFVARNLIDTSYANRVVLNTLSDYFRSKEIKTTVHTIRGSVTSSFRKRIKVEKLRDEDYSHHAIDALLVASLTHQRNISNVFSKFRQADSEVSSTETGEVLVSKDLLDDDQYIEDKYLKFVKEILLFNVSKFSWKVDKKPNRSISDQTIYSTRKVDGIDHVVKKYKDIYDKKLTAIAEDIINNNCDKYLMYRHDRKTFEKIEIIVKHYFDKFKDDSKMIGQFSTGHKKGKIEFKFNPLQQHLEDTGEYVTKYAKKGNGPIVKEMKYVEDKLGNHINISHKYNSNDKQVVLLQVTKFRTDFYLKVENGKKIYKFVTVQNVDLRYNAKKNVYVIDKNLYDKRKLDKGIDDSFKFMFSLQRNEYVELTKKDAKPELYRFLGTNNDVQNMIEVKPIKYYSTKRNLPSMGNSIFNLRKLAVTTTGKIYEIKQEVLKLEIEAV